MKKENMNSKEWEKKLLEQGSGGEDAWNMLKDLQILEEKIERLRNNYHIFYTTFLDESPTYHWSGIPSLA